MIPPYKLTKLHPRHRIRKAALLLEEAELSMRSSGEEERLKGADYAASLAAFLASDAEMPDSVREGAKALLAARPAGAPPDAKGLRLLNSMRHLLLRESGQAPADWDLLDPETGLPDPGARKPFPGVRAYLEDIRSPFNVGSMLRCAEAFGLEELILSPDTADPGHPRALRSSMGAASLVPWRREGLSSLREAADRGEAVFALELGGTALADFDFPRHGIVVLGSEELGVSTEALAVCNRGKVSIPMVGLKGSINVGVAFGILMYAWSQALRAGDCGNNV